MKSSHAQLSLQCRQVAYPTTLAALESAETEVLEEKISPDSVTRQGTHIDDNVPHLLYGGAQGSSENLDCRVNPHTKPIEPETGQRTSVEHP